MANIKILEQIFTHKKTGARHYTAGFSYFDEEAGLTRHGQQTTIPFSNYKPDYKRNWNLQRAHIKRNKSKLPEAYFLHL